MLPCSLYVLANVRGLAYQLDPMHSIGTPIARSSKGFVCRIIVASQILVLCIREIFASINS